MWVPVSMLSDEVMDKYQLHRFVVNYRVLTNITRSMYKPPQSECMAYEKIVKNLSPFGYHPTKRAPGLWKHETRTITFFLVVDDFGFKYVGCKHVDHLVNAIKTDYSITCDWEGILYCGVNIKWDYNA